MNLADMLIDCGKERGSALMGILLPVSGIRCGICITCTPYDEAGVVHVLPICTINTIAVYHTSYFEVYTRYLVRNDTRYDATYLQKI